MKHPNIIMVFPDQLQHDALHFRGKMPSITPNIDNFARESAVMENCMSNHPICSPCRAMMFTSRYGIHTGVVGNCRTGTREHGCYLKKNERCLTDVLRECGYDVGYIGKWHLDPPEETHLAFTEGFREDGKIWDSYTLPQRRHGINFWHGYGCCDNHLEPHYWHNEAKPDEVIRPGKWSVEHEADVAVDYIMNRGGVRDEEKPFMLFVANNPPHPPYDQVPGKYADLYRDKSPEDLLASPCFNVGDAEKADRIFPGNLSNGKAEQAVRYYLGALTGVDENFGRILRAIEDKGIYDDTIVIFTSDHGDLMGSHNMTGKGPWYRDSFNIPFIVRYPGKIAPSNPKTVMGAVDVMPTILSLAGLKSQIPSVAEGHDRSGCMLTGEEDEEADALYFCFGRYRARGLKTGKYTFVSLQNYADDEMTVLYDDENDYYQLEDISEKEPETAALLKERLEKRLEEIGDNWRD